MLAVIGGTGIYELAGMQVTDTLDAPTPFGEPSGTIVRGRLAGRELLFLARHGKGHRRLPHEVNYRANVFALKRAGATMALGFSAVGSLVEHVHPGDMALPNQYFDWTRGRRANSFFGDGVAAHVSTAEPISAAVAGWVSARAQAMALPLHRDLSYACVEGPRFGTRTESHFLRQAGNQLVGMTNVPEAFLAREAQIAYASLCIVTDYDCWMDDPAQHASLPAILQRYAQSLVRARTLLEALLAGPLPQPEASIRGALRDAVMTPDAALDDTQRAWLDVLRR
jgi:5'-methylthioadenosine phosphorylase